MNIDYKCLEMSEKFLRVVSFTVCSKERGEEEEQDERNLFDSGQSPWCRF